MSKTMFADIPEQDRLRVLLDNCDKKEETSYMKDLTQYELDAKRELLTTNYISLNDLDEELTKIKAGFKEKSEPLKLQNKSLLQEIKTGKEEKKGWLFSFIDAEDRIVNTFDEKGEFVSSRRLLPGENAQAKLFIAGGKAVGE